MHVIGHQAPGPCLDTRLAAGAAEQVAVKCIVLVAEEGPLAAVAALGHVMRYAGNDYTGEAGHDDAASHGIRGKS